VTRRALTLLELILVVAILAVLVAVLLPVHTSCGGPSKVTHCLSNAKQITTGFLIYQGDNDDLNPLDSTWVTALEPYTKNPSLYQCPEVKAAYAFAMNETTSGIDTAKEKHPERVVLVFESTKTTKNAHDHLESFPRPGRHSGKSMVGYLDGHAKQVLTLSAK
jgi:prepilin-type processing-associated H-X9-DG protein/prepilin-type N-terminal cleavage/methylation domain-containing protein